MKNNILVRTEVLKLVTGEFEGEKTFKIQSIVEDEKRGFSILSIKLIEEPIGIQDGDIVEIPIAISTMNSNIYYRQVAPLKKLNKA